MKADEILKKVTKVDVTYPEKVPEGHIRFVCLSDTHTFDECFQNVPDGDVLLHSGDFTNVGSTKEIEKF